MSPGMMGGYGGGSYGPGLGGLGGMVSSMAANGTVGWSFQSMWSWCLNQTGSFMHGIFGQAPWT